MPRKRVEGCSGAHLGRFVDSEEMATDMIVGKVSGGSDQFVSEARDRRARVSTRDAGASDDKGVDVGIHKQHRPHELVSYGRASPELESSDTSEDGGSWMHGFETGDMVWGKVKSHPWWPGHIFHESFASPSVRRSRREGHVLVAFFGDSSYGWFEPSELLPFDPHFTEKSKQTTSRNFQKAVEEAVDEVSRRRALAFSCLCRSPRNFRPACTPGHYAVDVIGYESGLVFSARQIKRARDSFVPVEVVSFLKKLVTSSHGTEQGSLEMTKMMATLLSLRKVLYEEFDETYAQAFGVEPVRPQRNELGVIEPPAKIAPRAAPLTGPLVFAEALGKKKGAAKAAKDQANKNKYLFKRRDDAPPRTVTDGDAVPVASSPPPSAAAVIVAHGPLEPITHPPTTLPPSASAAAVQYVADSGDYVLQKRTPPPDDSDAKPPPGLSEGSAVQVTLRESLADSEQVKMMKKKKRRKDVKPFGGQESDTNDTKQEQQEERKSPTSSPSEPPPASPVMDTKPFLDGQALPPGSSPPTTSDDASPQVRPRKKPFRDATVSGFVVDGGDSKRKKKRAVPLEDTDTVTDGGENKLEKKKKMMMTHEETDTDTGEKKLKKKKKKMTTTMIMKNQMDHSQSGSPTPLNNLQEAGATTTRDPSAQETPLRSPEVASSQDRKDSAAADTPPSTANNIAIPSFSAVALPKLDMNYKDLDFNELLPDLAALALDPFHGSERNLSLLVRHVFLMFRSLVYQKSLPLLRPLEGKEKPDATSQQQQEVQHKSRSTDAVADVPAAQQRAATTPAFAGEDREQKPKLSAGRPPKPFAEASVARPDDPTRTGRKRPLSDRQEERLVKKEKKLNQVKALTSHKKAAVKPLDGKEPKETGASPPPTAATITAAKKVVVDSTALSAKKPQDGPTPAPTPPLPPQAKVPSPTFLVMKFPPRASLPNISSLKARFCRFGPLEVSGCRVFWKTFTCKVLFKFRADALVAYGHAQNNNIYGQVNVTYSLRDAEVPAAQPTAEAPEPEKRGVVGAATATEAAASPRLEAAAVQFRPGRPGDAAVPLLPSVLKKPQPQQSQPVQLKSILKKPSLDDSSSPAGANGAKETPRVKFMIDGQANKPGVGVGGGVGNGSGVNGTPVTSSGSDVESFNSKISRLLAPAQTPTPPAVLAPRSTSEAYRGPPPPPLPLPYNVTLPPVTQDRRTLPSGKPQPAYQHQHPNTLGGDGSGPSGARKVDISGEMLTLLRRCRDVVSSVQSSLGLAPYRPL